MEHTMQASDAGAPLETAVAVTAALAAATGALGQPPSPAATTAATATETTEKAEPPSPPRYPHPYAHPPPFHHHPEAAAAAAAAGYLPSVIYSLRNCFLALNDAQFESEVETERTRRRHYYESSSASGSSSSGGKKPAPAIAAAATEEEDGNLHKKRAAAAASADAENEDSSNTISSDNKKQKTTARPATVAAVGDGGGDAAAAGDEPLEEGGAGASSSAWSYAGYPPPPYYYHHHPPPPPHAAVAAAAPYDPHHHHPLYPQPPPAAAAKRKQQKKKKQPQQQTAVASSKKKNMQPTAAAAAAAANNMPPARPPVQRVNSVRFWNEQYTQLQAFRQEFGHVVVPNKNKTYTSLHNWLRKIKEKWRKQVVMQEPVSCPLTLEQIQKLVDLGVGTIHDGPTNFAEQVIATEWDERFAELVTFKNVNGHTDVSDFKHKETHYKLAVWVVNQRKNFQNRQSMATTGKKKFTKNGVMTEEQMLKFASIGFRFSHVLKNIDERIIQIQEFKKVHGHTQVPFDYTGHSGLGPWVKKTKDAYHLGKLSASRIEKLDAIQFDWTRGQRGGNSSRQHHQYG